MSRSNPTFFFSATQSVHDRLGNVFSFIWASYAGLRELWWQVRGFQNEFPNIHINEIEKKFLSGLPMPGGPDLQRICLETDWLQHEQEFARWLLFDACTLYEGWVEKICFDIFTTVSWEKYAKNLQFPSDFTHHRNATGYQITISAANANTSNLMATEFYPNLKLSKLNCWSNINDNLIAYRFFKEIRNTFIHSDGTATADVVSWLGKLSVAQSANPRPFRHLFNLPNQTVGQKIKLDIHDCILFATVVRKLICTFDAALSVAATSENILEQRLRALVRQNTKWQNLPVDPVKKMQRIHRILAASRVPEPVNFNNVMAWMAAKKII